MKARSTGVHRGNATYATLVELLPNALHQTRSGPRAITDVTVIGRVTAVEKDFGFFAPGGDAPAGTKIDFDDSRVQWKTLRLTVQVERAFDFVSREGDLLLVGVAIGGNAAFDHVAAGFKALGRIIVFGYRNSPVFAHDPDLLSIVEDGALLTTVGARGQLRLPFLETGRATLLLRDSETLESLATSWARPPFMVTPVAALSR